MRRHAGTRRAAWLVALSFALTVLVVPPASAATLSASLTPDSANAGAQTTFTLTVTSQVRTLSLAAPAGFFVGSATSSRGTANVKGNQTVSVTGINGSQAVIVTITAWPKCTPGSSNTWTLNATGNPSTIYDPATFSTTVTPSSSCKLLFAPIADQQTGVASTVTVSAVRANNTVDTTYTDAISLSIEKDPGELDAALSGGGATTPTNGVASFNVSLNRAGTGYVLEACSPTINGGACDPQSGNGGKFLSGLFAVYDDVQPCQAGSSCSAQASAPGQVSTKVTANGQNGASIKAGTYAVPASSPGSSNPSNLDCAGYDEITEVIASFDFTSDVGLKTIVDTISAEQMKEIANQGVSFLQACFGSSLPFTDRSGNAAVFNSTLNKKDLAAFAPCVVSRQGGGNGTGFITMVAAEGDPGGKRH
jgi:hypothetical protein